MEEKISFENVCSSRYDESEQNKLINSLQLSDVPVKESQLNWWNFFHNSENIYHPEQSIGDYNVSNLLANKGDCDIWSNNYKSNTSPIETNQNINCSQLLSTDDIFQIDARKVDSFDDEQVFSDSFNPNKRSPTTKCESSTRQHASKIQSATRVKLKESKSNRNGKSRGTLISNSIHKRNERERERVRCVNEGYAELRQKLPLEFRNEKRVSKVETLRYAIMYIKHLQALINQTNMPTGCCRMLDV